MSGALAKLRDHAERAAAQLRDAEAKATEEAAAVRARNTERRAAFWADAGQQCATARDQADARLSDVRALIATGNPAAGLDAYATYRLHHAAWSRLVQSAQAATTRYVGDNGAELEPTAYGARRVYGPGVPTGDPSDPVPWATVLESALQAAGQAHAADVMAQHTGQLRASLEPEDDE